MPTIPKLLDGHVTLEVECLDRLYLNGYVGKLATGAGLVFFMREQLDKPVPSPVVLGQISEQFREAVKALAERDGVPVYQFRHKEKKDDLANEFRRQHPVCFSRIRHLSAMLRLGPACRRSRNGSVRIWFILANAAPSATVTAQRYTGCWGTHGQRHQTRTSCEGDAREKSSEPPADCGIRSRLPRS